MQSDFATLQGDSTKSLQNAPCHSEALVGESLKKESYNSKKTLKSSQKDSALRDISLSINMTNSGICAQKDSSIINCIEKSNFQYIQKTNNVLNRIKWQFP